MALGLSQMLKYVIYMLGIKCYLCLNKDNIASWLFMPERNGFRSVGLDVIVRWSKISLQNHLDMTLGKCRFGSALVASGPLCTSLGRLGMRDGWGDGVGEISDRDQTSRLL